MKSRFRKSGGREYIALNKRVNSFGILAGTLGWSGGANLAQVLWLWLAGGWRELRPGFTWGTAHALIDQMPDVPTPHASS